MMIQYQKQFSFFLFFGFILSNFLHTQINVQQYLNEFKNENVNAKSKISCKAIDLKSNETIIELNPDSSIVSASTTKLFSTFGGLEILEGDFQNKTKLYIDGEIDAEGKLDGNLWIRGGGDVSLGSKFFNKSNERLTFIDEWILAIKETGIKSISGYLISDGSEFGYEGSPDGWEYQDLGNYYGAHAQGVNFFDNTVLIGFNTFSPGKKTRINYIWPPHDSLVFDNQVLSAKISNDRAYLFGNPYEYNRIAKGSLPSYRDTFIVKGSMPDPEFLLAKIMKDKLNENSIQVSKGSIGVRNNWFLENNHYSNMKLVYEHSGSKLLDIIHYTNHKSVNLFAEGVLNSIGYQLSGKGTTSLSIEHLLNFYKTRIDVEGLELHDGSGLSRLNRISANHFISLLTYIYNSNNFEDFYNTLPIAGQSGTIKWLCKKGSGKGRIHAKSGTLNNVKSYAGYIESKSGRFIAFSFTVNDFSCTNYQIIKYMEPVLNKLSEL